MPCCAIITCKTTSQTSSIDKGGISFHRFPNEPKLKEQWMDVTGRENWFPTKSSTICSKHFSENDFIIKKSGNRYLIPGALPRIKIVHIHTSSLELQKTENIKENASNPILSTPKKHKSLKNKEVEENLVLSPNTSTPRERNLQNIIIYKDHIIKKQRLQIKRIQTQNRRLKKKVNKIEEVLNDLRKKFSLNSEGVSILKNINIKVLAKRMVAEESDK